MNIIKLNDIILPKDTDIFFDNGVYPSRNGKYDNAPEFIKLSIEEQNAYLAEFFNTRLKSRYAYWLHTRYVIPMDQINVYDYMDLEENKTVRISKNPDGSYNTACKLPLDENGYPLYIDTYDCDFINSECIDTAETDKINSLEKYDILNKFISIYNPESDFNPTADNIKKFRTNLALMLISLGKQQDGTYDPDMYSQPVIYMLEYYGNHMNDIAIDMMTAVGDTVYSSINTEQSHCYHCGGNQMGHTQYITSLYGGSMTVCNIIDIYKKNMYNVMVKTFSDLSFWLMFGNDFYKVFKLYIDNIIQMNLPLGPSRFSSEFFECGSTYDPQEQYIQILRALSTSLGYMINNQMDGHMNYIKDSFRKWSSILYEYMEW